MEPRITIIILAVANVSRATKFYEELGLPIETKENVSSFFQLDGIKLGILDRKYLENDAGIVLQKGGYSPFNLTHMVRRKEEVDQIMNKAEALGAKIIRRAEPAEWGAYSGFFADLDGNLWEIVYHEDWIPEK